MSLADQIAEGHVLYKRMSDDSGPASGMTLRDFFAAHALGGILTTLPWMKEAHLLSKFAENAYEYADAMLAARIRNDVKGEGG
jgi:hypothetical protein